ncbi:SH3 domain-containing protein [Piscinibacter terrae]|uniref:SH3 domain-containing protein n=1 Tax=Piscinibacter terrae TaxID=2496871 RepID=A0A3N7HUM9_9BURK|nr:SH3 domain-containing protein [Albitalea terrae]RQP25533.1 SH3 domain-containing protein [Albitalea terrae]
MLTQFRNARAVLAGLALVGALALPAQAVPRNQHRIVAGSIVNLRSSADDKSEVLARVPIATRVELLSTEGTWCRVRVPRSALTTGEATGFMACDLLRIHGYSADEILGMTASTSGRVHRDRSWGPVTSEDYAAWAMANERAFWFSPSLRWLFNVDAAYRSRAQLAGQDMREASHWATLPMRRLFERGFSTSGFTPTRLTVMSEPEPWGLGSDGAALVRALIAEVVRDHPRTATESSFFHERNELAAVVGGVFMARSEDDRQLLARSQAADDLADWALTNLSVTVRGSFAAPIGLRPGAQAAADTFGRIELDFQDLQANAITESGTVQMRVDKMSFGSVDACASPGFNVVLSGKRTGAMPQMLVLTREPVSPGVRAVRRSSAVSRIGSLTLTEVWTADLDADGIPDLMTVVATLPVGELPTAGPGPRMHKRGYRAWMLANIDHQWVKVAESVQWQCDGETQVLSG